MCQAEDLLVRMRRTEFMLQAQRLAAAQMDMCLRECEKIRKQFHGRSPVPIVSDITQEVRELNSEDMQEFLSAPIAMITGTTNKQD